jgi:uncharacterized membrane protein
MIQFNNGSGSGSATQAASNRWGDQLAGPDDTQVVSREVYGGEQTEQQSRSNWTAANVGSIERTVSVAAGSILALSGLGRRSVSGAIIATIGGAMLYRGLTGHCHLYQAAGIDTAHEDGEGPSAQETFERGITIETAMTINRPAEQLYSFWRDFTNLPKIMSHLESVTVQDGKRSHWVAKAPMVAGGRVEWDAEMTADEPNRRIAWQSVGGNTIDTAGEVRFEKAPGDRGTEVHVRMVYVPPAGKLGHLVTSLLGKNPKRLVREDLRNFQRFMEVGEIPTIIGQPHGNCAGGGSEYTESQWKPLFS